MPFGFIHVLAPIRISSARADPIAGHTAFYLATHQLTGLGVVCTLAMMLLLLGAAFVQP